MNPRELRSLALIVGLVACGGATTDSPGGSAPGADGNDAAVHEAGGAGGPAVDAAGDAGGAGAMGDEASTGCQCPATAGAGGCATAQGLCGLLKMPKCPTTVADVLADENINWAEVGCGKRMLARFSGTSDGMTYVFDVATGRLLGGTRYDDSPWGPCRIIAYWFGDALSLDNDGGLDCASKLKCGPNYGTGGTPVSDCLAAPSDAGRDADVDGD